MKFYNREIEIQEFNEIESLSRENAQMTVLVGRRRIGKTMLLLRATEGKTVVYLFVSKKTEAVLCQQFTEEASRVLNVPIGRYNRIADLLEHLMRLSENRPFTLIIDEFQELAKIDKSIIGDIQRVWDLNKDTARINLLISGSIYAMMHKIFEDSKEPLFSRAGHIIKLQAFQTGVLKQILQDYNPKHTADDLLALYSFTGGVAWYVELLMNAGAVTKEKIINYIFRENSLFLNEGKNILVEEFGKEYAVYFSVLECIARGITTRGAMESVIGSGDLGAYLSKLEKDYNIIRSRRPILAKSGTKVMRYFIADNFLTFWFRFIYKYMGYIESGGINILKDIVKRDYPTFSGIMLERYFRQKAIESGQYTQVGNYWDKKGENEIDIILINDVRKQISIGEIKRNVQNIGTRQFSDKIDHFLSVHPELGEYQLTQLELGLAEM
ncbi:MAG: ATP-binding protein [Bacteroidales bacterium]|nr:ATP-binding protein [Bacteroidales bacterium]